MHSLPAFVAQLARLQSVQRVKLALFGRAETAQPIALLLGEPPPAQLVERVFRLSEGNAFFIEELVSSGVSAEQTTLPDSLRDLLLDRVDRLPEPTRHVVRVVAASGLSVPHGLLADAAGMDEISLLAALRPAVDAHVLVVDQAANGYCFRHTLLREVILEDLLPAERGSLQRAFAEALEARPELVPSDRLPAELALHWSGAGEVEKAVPALLRAATSAEAKCAYAEQSKLLLRGPVTASQRRG